VKKVGNCRCRPHIKRATPRYWDFRSNVSPKVAQTRNTENIIIYVYLIMYFQLRVTPCAFKCPWEIAIQLVKSLINSTYDLDESCYITADEKTNKFGEAIKRHFHFNFICDGKKDTIQKWIRKWFSDRDFVCKGNQCYCLQQTDEPEDIKRWLRYNMKEKYLGKLTKLPYTVEEIKEMETLAKDERSRSSTINLKKREKLLNTQTLFDKICKKLEKENFSTKQEIFIFIGKYYLEEGKPVNYTTIEGYTYNWLLRKNLISWEDFYSKKC